MGKGDLPHTGRGLRRAVLAGAEPLPSYTQGVLDSEVQGRTGLTPFARWAAVAGVWPLTLLALGVVVGFARLSARRARAARAAPP